MGALKRIFTRCCAKRLNRTCFRPVWMKRLRVGEAFCLKQSLNCSVAGGCCWRHDAAATNFRQARHGATPHSKQPRYLRIQQLVRPVEGDPQKSKGHSGRAILCVLVYEEVNSLFNVWGASKKAKLYHVKLRQMHLPQWFTQDRRPQLFGPTYI